jgi:4-hydroxybenzoate polyprenyltransferase
MNQSIKQVPLCVDLDGTLIYTDMLHESALKMLRHNPIDTLRIPYWLSQGKAVLKDNIAQRVSVNPKALPYNIDLIDWLNEQRTKNRQLILCTATDISIAHKISEHLGLFDEVIASGNGVNLAGKQKAEVLKSRFGHQGFDYIGNSSADLAVWQHARKAIVVNASSSLTQKAQQNYDVELVFPKPKRTVTTWFRVLRLHQWVKNTLLFVPLLAAHQFSNIDTWVALILAFFSFSLCASSVYVANDLFDLDSDRLHPRKHKRPFASGYVPVWVGILLIPLLLFSSFALAQSVGGTFIPWLSFYFVLTCIYTWSLKSIVLLDCLTLAMLYTLRIVTGAAAASMSLSFWLLAFSIFLFLSLAFVKRYAELEIQLLNGERKIHGRGYYSTDAPLVQTLGITSGYAAVLVLALYLNSSTVTQLYKTPELIWAAVPVM